MGCLLLTASTTDCNYILAGVTDLWLTNFTWLSASTATALTMSGSAKFFRMEFENNSASFTNELVPGIVKHVKQGISWQTASQGQTISDVANALGLGTYAGIVKTRTGKKFLIGRTGNGLSASQLSLNSGAADTDTNIGMIVTLEGGATEFALEYTGADSTIPTY